MVRAEESWDARHFRFAGETNESQIGKKNPKTWPECKFSGFNTRMPGEFRLGDFFFFEIQFGFIMELQEVKKPS